MLMVKSQLLLANAPLIIYMSAPSFRQVHLSMSLQFVPDYKTPLRLLIVFAFLATRRNSDVPVAAILCPCQQVRAIAL